MSIPLHQFVRHHGFTLIELMVTISILAILLGIAVPAFTSFITSNRLSGQINELVGDLSFARSEAGARSRAVRLCIAATATTCATSGSDWSLGRILWVDLNGSNSLDSSTELLKYVATLEGSATLTAAGFPSTFTISYLPTGVLSSTSAGTFTLCASGSPTGRLIDIPVTGRASAKRIETCP